MTVLVAHASKHGSTAQIAERIAAVLAEQGLTVRCCAVDKVESLDGVTALVLGGAVYAGSWPKRAGALVDRVQTERPGLPAWAFSSGPVGEPLGPSERPAMADAVAHRLDVRDHPVFAGSVERRQLSFAERGLVTAMRIKDGDYRDWDAIEAWAKAIAAELVNA